MEKNSRYLTILSKVSLLLMQWWRWAPQSSRRCKYFLNKNKDKNDFIIKLFGMRVKLRRFGSFKIDKNKIDITTQVQLFQIMKLL